MASNAEMFPFDDVIMDTSQLVCKVVALFVSNHSVNSLSPVQHQAITGTVKLLAPEKQGSNFKSLIFELNLQNISWGKLIQVMTCCC